MPSLKDGTGLGDRSQGSQESTFASRRWRGGLDGALFWRRLPPSPRGGLGGCVRAVKTTSVATVCL